MNDTSSSRTASPYYLAATFAAILVVLLLVFFLDDKVFENQSDQIDPSLTWTEQVEQFRSVRLEYDAWALAERKRHFTWNLRSTKFIFWLSVMVSVSGLAFSFWQFSQAAALDRAQTGEDDISVKTGLIELSLKTKRFATVVLLFSLMYLMIYVIYLYPVRNENGGGATIFLTQPTAQSEKPKRGKNITTSNILEESL